MKKKKGKGKSKRTKSKGRTRKKAASRPKKRTAKKAKARSRPKPKPKQKPKPKPKGTHPTKKSRRLRGFTLWFTGLSGSGKSTIADRVAELLDEEGYMVQRLDGDIVRKSLTKDLGFSKRDRDLNIERITFVSEVLTKNGVATLVSFISPYIKARDNAREQIGSFIEVFVKCSLEECIKRDVKGLYQKAIAGEIPEFTGISDPYEEPPDPEIVLETDKESLRQCAKKVMDHLKRNGHI